MNLDDVQTFLKSVRDQADMRAAENQGFSQAAQIISRPLYDPKNRWKEFLCVEKIEPTAILPVKSSDDDAGYDLAAFGTFGILPWSSVLVDTKIKISVPPGHYGRIAARSGLAVKNNIEVGAGVIDRNYQGEIKVLLRNFSDSPYNIQHGDRIAQLIITPYANLPVKSVLRLTDLFGESNRGAKGFGSSGV